MRKDLDLFVEIVNEFLEHEKTNPVVKPISVEQMYEEFDIELQDEPMIDKDFIPALKKIVKNSPRTASKLFFNQLFGGRHSRSMLGELLSAILNQSMYTYKIGGPQIGIEKEIIKQIAERVGYDNHPYGGTFAPGGSMTNLKGLLMARDAKDPKARYEGVSLPLTVYTSAESHYSIPKNMAFAGIGRNNLRFIEADDQGKMRADLLEEAIKKDIENRMVPCMVNATAGTTVLAAIDPIQDISRICKKYNVWLHVDGAYCGSLIFSQYHRTKLRGIEQADSFTINAHKMLLTPLSCSMIVAKDKKHLYDTFSNDASYLYQTANDDYNPGKISMQCGRRNDALKFWTLWKTIGSDGIEDIVNKEFDLANYAKDYIRDNINYTLYNEEESIAICFNYKGIDPKILCNTLYAEGEILVGYGKFRDDEFIRMVTVNGGNSKEDIHNFFKVLEKFVDENEDLLKETKDRPAFMNAITEQLAD